MVLDSTARFKVLCCGRRWGKSLVAQKVAIDKMLQGKRCVYVTHKFFLSRKFFREYLKLLPEAIISSSNKSDLIIELITGGSIVFLSGEAPESFKGFEFDFAICDEAAHIPDFGTVWEGEILPTLAITEGEALIISTPKGTNAFHSLFLLGKSGTDPEYTSFHFPSNTNPFFPKAEFEKRRKGTTAAKFAEEYLAIPGQNSSSAFGTDNINQNIITELSMEPTVVFGCDVAKHHDFTVILGLDANGYMTYHERFNHVPWTLIQKRIEALPANVLKVVDCSGTGDMLYEALERSCQNIQGFVFTSASKPSLIEELIMDVQQGKVKYIEAVADEMHVFQYVRSDNSRYTKYEAQPGFFDDQVIALALANRYKNQAVADAEWFIDFGD